MKYILTTVSLVVLTCISVSQSDPESDLKPWPITERCLLLETELSSDFAFEGTLLTRNRKRLIGYAYDGEQVRSSVIQSGLSGSGRLSPNSMWYLFFVGKSWEEGLVSMVVTREIRVYSTMDNEVYSIPWDDTYSIMRRRYGHRLYWIDNSHLLYSKTINGETWFIIDPFSGDVQQALLYYNPTAFAFELSPDAQKGLSAHWPDPFWTIESATGNVQVPIRLQYQVLWHPSSEYFVTTTWPENPTEPGRLLIIDLHGDVVHYLYQSIRLPSTVFTVANAIWSDDGRYLTFVDQHLYIADMETQQVFDTCITPISNFSYAWSPDSNQIALFRMAEGDTAVHILDMKTYRVYRVVDNVVSLIGWRANEVEH